MADERSEALERASDRTAELEEIVRKLAGYGHDDYRDGTGECPFCSLGQSVEHREYPDGTQPSADQHDAYCIIGEAMHLCPIEVPR